MPRLLVNCLLATVALLALVPAGAARAAEKVAGKRYAVIVGVNSYESSNITPLRYAVADAHALADALRALGYDEVFELTSDRPGSDAYPKKTNVLWRLEWVRDRIRPEDSLVFYFSGHGMEVDGKTYLLTRDSEPRSPVTLRESACSASVVREILDGMKARRILVVYDACRSNPHADKGGGENLLTTSAARDLTLTTSAAATDGSDRVLATLFACKPGQRSYESTESEHGYFTYRLVEGLRGAAANQGAVTLQSLMHYVSMLVPHDADHAGYQQQPWAETAGTSLTAWILNGRPDAVTVAPGTVAPPGSPVQDPSQGASAPSTIAYQAPGPAAIADVPAGSYALQAVRWTVANGFIVCGADGRFEGHRTVPRYDAAESFARLIRRSAGALAARYPECKFVDVPATREAVLLVSRYCSPGRANNRFCGALPITRGELADWARALMGERAAMLRGRIFGRDQELRAATRYDLAVCLHAIMDVLAGGALHD